MTAYRWNDPARTLPRRRLADRIRAEVGPETDSWDLPEPSGKPHGSSGGSQGGLPYLLGCGTEAAYKRHRRNGEDACPECLDGLRRAISRRRGRVA